MLASILLTAIYIGVAWIAVNQICTLVKGLIKGHW